MGALFWWHFWSFSTQHAERGLFEPLAMARKVSVATVGRQPVIFRIGRLGAARAGHGFPRFRRRLGRVSASPSIPVVAANS
jgi:hypothetical protein